MSNPERYPDRMQAAVADFHDAFGLPNAAAPTDLTALYARLPVQRMP